MASIRKRTWRTPAGGERSAWVVNYVDGQGRRRLRTFKTKKAADAWRAQTQGEIARGVHTPDGASVTVTQAAELWLARGAAEGLEPATLKGYEQHVRLYLAPMLGRDRLSRLTVPRVEGFKDQLLTRARSRAHARKLLGTLKAILTDAQRRGLVAQNVATPVRIGVAARHEAPVEVGRDIPTKGEVRALLAAAEGSPKWRAFLMLACFTGLRASELRGLPWSNVDLEAQLVRVRQRADRYGTIGSPKSKGSRRDVPLPPPALNALKAWRLACPASGADLVFPASGGRVPAYSHVRRGVDATMIAAGLVDDAGRPKYALHGLRHWYASWLIDQGLGPKRVQALLGHATIGMTLDTYTHLWPGEDDGDKLAAAALAVVG